ncbi:hypothetical protein FE88_29875 [Azospirillum brasilense]|nr:hypothetical protein FE89_28760 [Azospirillum brasilense]OPH17768.1 hypothetical protein FE88_29875 [Azospirillum brasilense]PWC88769.1 hypothetical protein AEJ54_23200 [Azospirillum sp. Sp 7]TVZ67543.1 hypothetical protein OH82_00683 [Azospirillum brasilense]TWB84736.1 hypothetical protein FBZ81_1032 [Azospirillum brasilense]
MNRRNLMKGAALPGGMPRMAAAAGVTRITVADPGDPYSPAFRNAFYDPFEKATGIKVVNVARDPTNLGAYRHIHRMRARTLPTFEDSSGGLAIAKEDWWSVDRSKMNERFNAWILG